MATDKTVHLVFSTHWDREWVQTFEQYRFRLVNLFDRLLGILEAEPSIRFVFDGQTIVLEDYLEIRPENEGRVRRHAETGRLVFGPWHVLADQFLEGPEATLRNLFIGRRTAARFGGAMQEGYVPDSFGSLATLPLILNGFGIRHANFGRGLAHTDPARGGLFFWRWKDGSEVLAIARGYNNGVALAYPDIWRDIERCRPDLARVAEIARHLVRNESATLPVDTLLLVAGIDHMEMRPGMSAVVDTVNAGQDDARFLISDPRAYLEAAEAEVRARGIELETVQGEMRGDAARPMDLQGVLSTNREMKRRNRACERKVEGHLEPLDVIHHALTGVSHTHFVDRAWRLIVQNHPHDSICACSLDAVTADIMARFDHADQLHEIMTERILRNLTPCDFSGAETPALVLLNTVPHRGSWTFEGLVRVPCLLAGDVLDLVDDNGVVVGEAAMRACRNTDLETWYATNAGLAQLECKRPGPAREPEEICTLLDIRGVADFREHTGFRTLALRERSTDVPPARPDLLTGERSVENLYLHVEADESGAITLRDKITGATHRGLCWFEDDADLGNAYDYLPLHADTPVRSRMVSSRTCRPDAFSVSLETVHEIMIPAVSGAEGRSMDLRRHEIVSTFTIAGGCRHLAVRTEFENCSLHHRLRMGIRLDPATVLTSGGHFAAIERPWGTEGGQFACRPMMDYLHMRAEGGGLAFLARGQYEFEPRLEDGCASLYVTLLRSVDSIGPGAGCNYPLERTKELGPHTVEYAFAPAATVADAANLAAAHSVAVLAEGYMDNAGVNLPGSVLSYSTDRVVHSCMKRAEDRSGTVVRFYNPSDEPAPVSLDYELPHADAVCTRLDETPIEDATFRATPSGACITAAPHAAVTMKFPDL